MKKRLFAFLLSLVLVLAPMAEAFSVGAAYNQTASQNKENSLLEPANKDNMTFVRISGVMLRNRRNGVTKGLSYTYEKDGGTYTKTVDDAYRFTSGFLARNVDASGNVLEAGKQIFSFAVCTQREHPASAGLENRLNTEAGSWTSAGLVYQKSTVPGITYNDSVESEVIIDTAWTFKCLYYGYKLAVSEGFNIAYFHDTPADREHWEIKGEEGGVAIDDPTYGLRYYEQNRQNGTLLDLDIYTDYAMAISMAVKGIVEAGMTVTAVDGKVYRGSLTGSTVESSEDMALLSADSYLPILNAAARIADMATADADGVGSIRTDGKGLCYDENDTVLKWVDATGNNFAMRFYTVVDGHGYDFQRMMVFTPNFDVPEDRGGITVTKVNENGAPLAGATFRLYDENDQTKDDWLFTTDANGTFSTEKNDLPFGTYTLVEVSGPANHITIPADAAASSPQATLNGAGQLTWKLVVNKAEQLVAVRAVNHYNRTSVTVNKVWNDSGNRDGLRPSSVTVNLKANGNVVRTATVSASEGWQSTFSDLDKYQNGSLISYTVEEAVVPPGYTATVDGFTITNTHVPSKISLTVTKAWEDAEDQDGRRPSSITVNLKANGNVVRTATVTAADGWQVTFDDLDEYQNGAKISYTAEESYVPSGYTATVNGLAITNTHSPEKTAVTVVKKWDDWSDQDGLRPSSVTVNLKANGNVVRTATVTAADGWRYTFSDLDKYQNGSLITYTVEEAVVPAGYTATVDGFTITNTHDPEFITGTITKVWDDGNYWARPNYAEFEIFADGEFMGYYFVYAEDGWVMSLEEYRLEKYRDGRPISYTIREIDVPDGYSVVSAEWDGNNFVVTNKKDEVDTSFQEETVEVTVSKVWRDDNDCGYQKSL